jgi:hypothetical protein
MIGGQASREPPSPDLSAQVETILKSRLSDQHVVEIETAELVASRLMGWAKTAGFFIGIPLVLLAAILSFFGVKTYSDLATLVDRARDEIVVAQDRTQEQIAKVQALETKIAELEQSTTTTVDRIASLDQQLDQAENGLRQRFAAIETRQDAIESDVRALLQGRVEFDPQAALKPDQMEHLAQYLSFLEGLGFPRPDQPVRITTENFVPLNAYYNPSNDSIVVDPRIAGDLDVAFREYTHPVLFSAGPERRFPQLTALESGLADYFPASYTNDPKFGEVMALAASLDRDFVHNLDNQRSFGELAELDPTRLSYDGAEVWGGAFWQIRQTAGAGADALLAQAWRSFAPEGDAEISRSFVAHLLRIFSATEGEEKAAAIKRVLEDRGFPVG